MHRSQRTTRQFQYGAFSKQSPDLLMGLEGKANVGLPFAAGDLQGTVNLGNER
jgi:hypothetical protein